MLSKRIIAILCIAISLTLGVNAQDKLQSSPGGYHGELDFPISWSRYYPYAEWTKIMHDIQKQYPKLSSIESIGKSRMGRDQFLITITAKKTGDHSSKPAMWVDGAVHGNEVNGITCSLYTMWYLLTRYDYDPYVHELINTTTFYILPGLNVDANASFVEHPNTPNNPREPYRPEDNDGDGLYDEDQTEDIDGDGELSTMYKEDPNGLFKLSIDGRRFERVIDKMEKVMHFHRIGSEGFDNDGDGRINEDDIGGPDPNRNYPAGWNMQAGNPYTMSEPETRNAFEFQLAHPNIFAAFHYHNTGRLIMFVLYCASQFPKVEIEKIELIPSAKNLFWVDVIVKNERIYPTVSDRKLKLKRSVKDKIYFSSSNNIELIAIPSESTTIETFNSSAKSKSSGSKETEFLLGGEDSLRIRYLVKTNGKKGWIEFKTDSKAGGKDKKRIEIASN